MENELKVRFNLADFSQDPDSITELLGIEPTMTWRKGDPIGQSVRFHPENGWRLASGMPVSSDLEDQLLSLLDRLEPLEPSISSINGASLEISCIVYAYDGAPTMNFGPETLRRIARLGATLDIDLYWMEAGEETTSGSP